MKGGYAPKMPPVDSKGTKEVVKFEIDVGKKTQDSTSGVSGLAHGSSCALLLLFVGNLATTLGPKNDPLTNRNASI